MTEEAKGLILTVQFIIAQYGWWICGLIFLALQHKRIEQFIGVMTWKLGRRYNERMKVIVNGYYCRIAKIGLLYVEFYVYNKVNDPPTNGRSWMVAGSRLDSLDIWIPLEKFEKEDSAIQTVSHIP